VAGASTLGLLLGCSATPTAAPETSAAPSKPPTPAPAPVDLGTPESRGWNLAWADEFDGDSLDESRWTALDESTYGDGNLSQHCYLSQNVSVANGLLTITADRPDTPRACGSSDTRYPGGREFTSGFIETKKKASFLYGRFEMSAKVPMSPGRSQGLWPAFWLRPEDRGIGELDVMEMTGSDARTSGDLSVVQTMHYDYEGGHPKEGTDITVGADFGESFHEFAVEWEPGEIRWYLDGALTYTRTSKTTTWLDEAFSRPMFLRLNLAVGGSWPGEVDADTAFPAEYIVDHLRVYSR
jgi:beta-glucanase (GH16 family)